MSADGEQDGVTQADRDAAGKLFGKTDWSYSQFVTGKRDKDEKVLAFMRHRLAHAAPATDTPEVVMKALDQCVGIESGPNGQGGMRVVVHFKGGGDEYPLFSLLNAALAKHATSPEDAA